MLAFWKNNKKAWGSRCVSGGRMGRDGIKRARRRMGELGTAVHYLWTMIRILSFIVNEIGRHLT